MCVSVSVKSEDIEAGLPPTCGERLSAKAEKRAAEHPSPLLSPPLTPKIKAEDSDDVLLDLRFLFGALNVDDSEDDSESDSEDSAPNSPRAKCCDLPSSGWGLKRFYFYALGRLYFHDEERNVFMENAGEHPTLIHSAPPFMANDSMFDLFNADFRIDGIPFFFDISNNLFNTDQGTVYPVVTWPGDTGPSAFDQALSPTFIPRTPAPAPQSNMNYTSTIQFEYPVSNGAYCDDTKTEPKTEVFNANPLNNSLQGTMPWSPGSSTLSPIVSAGSRAPSEGLEPLIRPEHNLGWIAGIQLWKEETKVIQEARNPVPSDKMDRRRCPQCSKVFRRPSSLEDHLNVHSGAKPHICPFERCKTGFATKSNMKRHFVTHRAGGLEEYAQGGKVIKSKSRTATYNAKAFHTQRFRLSSTA